MGLRTASFGLAQPAPALPQIRPLPQGDGLVGTGTCAIPPLSAWRSARLLPKSRRATEESRWGSHAGDGRGQGVIGACIQPSHKVRRATARRLLSFDLGLSGFWPCLTFGPSCLRNQWKPNPLLRENHPSTGRKYRVDCDNLCKCDNNVFLLTQSIYDIEK